MRNSPIKNLSYMQQLLKLRYLVEEFGVLHEAHALNLRLWPFSVDPKLDRAEAKVDMPEKGVVTGFTSPGLVTYDWFAAKRPKLWRPDRAYQQRLTELERALHLMLGETWQLKVNVNGQSISWQEPYVKPRRTKKRTSPHRKSRK